ncbi:methylated-DNA--protein-cysteine methyltransferase [Marivirga lumbricoides]|uniref:methylated-DNA--[protein]-cysteine S-methyltransferase n=1 Tax=Marivirga lumbricoides TaxID=1046115 RepID=A0A2T4DI45_9BACT|nr:cysteine methyltransferase [Marivirga lumbricoides]GGC26719.1 methylated-DNA--protein-cysteine methyltransferase [Marivirga lumbricoides]
MSHNSYYYLQTPLGFLKVEVLKNKLIAISFVDEKQETSGIKPEVIMQLEQQLQEYFNGLRKKFTVPYLLQGTEFQIQVWEKLNEIACGKTISYGKFAAQLGDIKKIRAVANAIGKNPLPIIIPCHRVVGAQGQLTGYLGGLQRKKILIETEHQKQLNLFAK